MELKTKLFPTIGVFATVLFQTCDIAGAAESGTSQISTSSVPAKAFVVFDNMPPQAKMDGPAAGMAPCDIIRIPWKEKNKAPDEEAMKTKVREIVQQPKYANQPGLLVLDIEYVHDFRLFINLVKMVHEAAPGHPVGFYGHGLFPEQPGKGQQADAKELAADVDAFLPSMYNFDDNREAWRRKLTALVNEARRIAPGKPVYPYMWPGYHIGTRKALHLLSGNYWKFQLETARSCGADGLVIWGNGGAHWNDKSTWREDTLNFLASKPTVESPKAQAPQKDQSDRDDIKKNGD
jgi:hypothetical protein